LGGGGGAGVDEVGGLLGLVVVLVVVEGAEVVWVGTLSTSCMWVVLGAGGAGVLTVL
jgi:hypothetical protein